MTTENIMQTPTNTPAANNTNISSATLRPGVFEHTMSSDITPVTLSGISRLSAPEWAALWMSEYVKDVEAWRPHFFSTAPALG